MHDPAERAAKLTAVITMLADTVADLAEVIDAIPAATDEQLETQARILHRLSEELWEAHQGIRGVLPG